MAIVRILASKVHIPLQTHSNMVAARALVAQEVGAPLLLQPIILDKPRGDEAIVQIHAVGICHADIACVDGKLPAQFPSVFGHEGTSYGYPQGRSSLTSRQG